MKNFLTKKPVFLRKLKRFFAVIACLFLVCLLPLFASCKKEIDYFDYVSELRSNIFLAETDDFSLRVYAVEKETPYVSDGVPMETSKRIEVYLVAPSGDKTCNLSFTVFDKAYGGEMSFDNVKAEYYFSCTLDVSELTELTCHIEYGEEEMELCALSIKTETTRSPKQILEDLKNGESELFSSMTDKYGFTGEIYIRILYEDFPYYYVGVIDRNGKTNAFLLNGETGKILAKRES